MQCIFRGQYDIWVNPVWQTLGKRKLFLVKGRMGANKHRQEFIGNCSRMIKFN